MASLLEDDSTNANGDDNDDEGGNEQEEQEEEDNHHDENPSASSLMLSASSSTTDTIHHESEVGTTTTGQKHARHESEDDAGGDHDDDDDDGRFTKRLRVQHRDEHDMISPHHNGEFEEGEGIGPENTNLNFMSEEHQDNVLDDVDHQEEHVANDCFQEQEEPNHQGLETSDSTNCKKDETTEHFRTPGRTKQEANPTEVDQVEPLSTATARVAMDPGSLALATPATATTGNNTPAGETKPAKANNVDAAANSTTASSSSQAPTPFQGFQQPQQQQQHPTPQSPYMFSPAGAVPPPFFHPFYFPGPFGHAGMPPPHLAMGFPFPQQPFPHFQQANMHQQHQQGDANKSEREQNSATKPSKNATGSTAEESETTNDETDQVKETHEGQDCGKSEPSQDTTDKEKDEEGQAGEDGEGKFTEQSSDQAGDEGKQDSSANSNGTNASNDGAAKSQPMMYPMHPAMAAAAAAGGMMHPAFFFSRGPMVGPPFMGGAAPYPMYHYQQQQQQQQQNVSPSTQQQQQQTGQPMQMQPMQMEIPHRGISLALACDVEQLSDYQILVRQQLELFEAGPEDVESNTQGRKKPVALGQVGLRCRHCAGFPLRARGRGAVYYPAKLHGIYQAAQNMAGSHLCQACQQIPPSLRQEIRRLRERKDNASGGKQYWADGCRALGLYESDSGLRIARNGI